MNPFWLISRSLYLDYRLIQVSRWKRIKKWHFVFLKYYILAKHILQEFEFGKHSVRLFGYDLFYDSKYGLADYQSILTRQQDAIRQHIATEVGIVIDVGANVGFFTLLVHDLFPEATVHAFEPITPIFNCLKKNISHFNNIILNNCALSDRVGKAQMSFDAKQSGLSKFNNKGSVSVELTTLDKYIEINNITYIDMLKVDTETFESEVLRGAQKSLSITKYLFIEITLKHNPNYTISSLFSLLHDPCFDFQLLYFRNYADKGEGEIPIMDCLLVNEKLRRR